MCILALPHLPGTFSFQILRRQDAEAEGAGRVQGSWQGLKLKTLKTFEW